MKRIFISAGEQSGDIHGANLMRAIREIDSAVNISGLGCGGMISEGMECLHDMTHRSVMWFHVLGKINEFLDVLWDTEHLFKTARPDIVILIDYCGLNFYIAKAARRLGIPVMYYVSPQIWAHGGWRVRKIKNLVDKMVVIYPFEEEIYRAGGVPVKYVGNPVIDELTKRGIDNSLVDTLKGKHGDNIITICPGSRRQEIERCLPILLKAAGLIHGSDRTIMFVVSCSDGRHEDGIRRMVASASLPAEVVCGNLGEIVTASRLCLTCSGTVTLKIAYYLTPMVVMYRISAPAYFMARPFMQTRYLSLVNRLADDFIVPERLLYKDDFGWVASSAMNLLNNPAEMARCEKDLQGVRAVMDATPGASQSAAAEAMGMIT